MAESENFDANALFNTEALPRSSETRTSPSLKTGCKEPFLLKHFKKSSAALGLI